MASVSERSICQNKACWLVLSEKSQEICFALNDVSSGIFNSQKDHEDEVFSLRKYIAIRREMYRNITNM